MPEVTKRINILYLNGVEYSDFFFFFFAFRTNRWYEVVSFPVGSFLLFFGKFDVKKVVTNMRTLLKAEPGFQQELFHIFFGEKIK